jgi:vancomycin resistance protein YoaR
VGPINARRNYYPGLNRLGPNDVSGIAGGAARVASALYRAAYTAGLGIERRVAPPYVDSLGDPGLDAVAYAVKGGPDLVIKNTTDHPVLIKTAINPTNATVGVYLFNTQAALPVTSYDPPVVTTHPDGRVDVSTTRRVSGPQPTNGDEAETHYSPLEAP